MIVDPARDLPEQKSLTLLVLPPSIAWDENGGSKEAIQERVLAISSRCGGKDRLYRNTLLFLAGTARGLSKLRQAYRERAALEAVRRDYWDQLDEEQREDLKKRLEAARKAALEALGPAYTVALRVRGQEVEVCVLSDARRSFQEHLGYVWTTLVEDEEWILRRVGSVTLQNTGLIPKEGGIRLKDAVEAFLRFTDKPMVAAKEAVTTGLAQACADGLVGIGRGASLASLQARYCKQAVSLEASEDGVWIIPAFTPEPARARGYEPTAGGGVGATETERGSGLLADTSAGQGPETTSGTKLNSTGAVRRVVVRGSVPVESWSELFRCFVGPAARMNLKKLGIGVHFEMVLPEDRPLSENDPALKAMKEAARQLGLELHVEG
ncbi:MAG: hypothetical protein KatS3mg077_0010 [Candidatus Binatia bacterium]|nr:MAG: hypothetical protein KatS3mg077_0010 [Candidatus Binatia bacterium]